MSTDMVSPVIEGWRPADTSVPEALGGAIRREAPKSEWNLPLLEEGRFYEAELRGGDGNEGTLVVELSCPRPLRMWVGEAKVLDEPLFWRSFQRQVRCAFVVPWSGGAATLRVEVGPRPRHPAFVDDDCPSRNREKVLAGLRETFPDAISISLSVSPVVEMPTLSIRFLPSQYVSGGVTWQHALLRHWQGPATAQASLPSVDAWSPVEQPSPRVSVVSPVVPYACAVATSSEEAERGISHLHVPIASHGAELEPLRQAGDVESRLEPSSEVVRTIELLVEGPAGGVALSMPIYEGMGRLAPEMEYSPAPWPDCDALAGSVPEPVLPPSYARYGELYQEAWRMLRRLHRQAKPFSGIPNDYISTGTSFVYHQFVWDTSFTALCTAYGFRAVPPYASMNLLYSRQFDGGYIHREHDIRDGMPVMYEPDFSPNPPIMSVVEWAMAGVTGDSERLRRVYPALKALHAWIRANRLLPDGTYWTTGLANGLDNSPSLGLGYPCLTAQMAHDAEALGKIASRLGFDEDARQWDAERAAIADALNERLWSDEMRFYSTSLPGGGHNMNKVVTGFWPLWAGVVPPERVEALAGHLKDKASFWRHHPIPSLAADSPHFVPGGQYWLGSSWAPTNYAAIKGFQRAGRHDLALETTLRHLDCMSEVYKSTGYIWENYCSETSDKGSWCQYDYCWSALGPIALLFEVVIGLELDALNNTVHWRLPASGPAGPLGVRNMPLGPATLSLVYSDQGDSATVAVSTDAGFTLALEVGGATQSRQFGPGTHSWRL